MFVHLSSSKRYREKAGVGMSRLKINNTLRNQIFLGFFIVMLIVLSTVGLFVYKQVSDLLLNNAEKHIQQTAAQAMGQLEVLFNQIDTFTTQVATNDSVQRILGREYNGIRTRFLDRQLLEEEVRKLEAYTTGVRSVELYTKDYYMLLPITEANLKDRVSESWIERVDREQGKLVWLGLDPRYPNDVIAMKQVRLMDRSFTFAGYEIVYIDKSYFNLTDIDISSGVQEYMFVVDEQDRIITGNYSGDIELAGVLSSNEQVEIDGKHYLTVKNQSPATGWSIVILTPVEYSTEGISVLQTAILVSVIVGSILFFILTFIMSSMITRPILNLIRAMRNVRFGTLKPISISSNTVEIKELHNTYNQMVRSLRELNEVVYQKEIMRSRSELKALQAQINPHFLFNTLEAFYWALEEKGEEDLAKIVVAMSGLFRYVISREDEEEWVTLGDELDHAERYLTIMQMRLMDRLKWEIVAERKLRAVPIPKLLIQPLVENAILHGAEQRIDEGTVIVRVQPAERPDYVRIEVVDNGPGMDEQQLSKLKEAMMSGTNPAAKGTGVGLVNVQRRLRLYYESETSRLLIDSVPGQGTTVGFIIPINQHFGGEDID